MTIGQSSFINLPLLYVNGLELSWFTPKMLTVESGRARDASNSFDINLETSIIINGAANGINALDKGTLAANTWYRVFIIYASNSSISPACILSTDSIPLFPNNNYDYFKRIGWVKTDESSNFVQFIQSGNGSIRTYQWRTFINVLTNGQSETFASVNLSAGLPPSFVSNFGFAATFYGNFAGNFAGVRPYGSDTEFVDCPIRFITIVDAVPVFPNAPYVSMIPGLLNDVPTIEYILDTNTHLNIDLLNFTDYI